MMKSIGTSGRALLAAVAGAAAVGIFALGPQLFTPDADARPITVQAPLGAPISFADLIERVEPAVVSVNVVSEQEVASLGDMQEFFERFRGMPGFEDFMEEQRRRGAEDKDDEDEDDEPETREARALGSGFIISADGLVVTNHHVIDKATRIEVTLTDGRELECELVGSDKNTDLAVLRIKEKGTYPFVRFATGSHLRKGDWVVALGNPFGLGGTATAGILSADHRDLGRDSPYTDFLQIDAAINRGNSGGPTFDLNGNVIGVNTQIISPTGGSVGIGFAIPSELAKDITDRLIKDGKIIRGWLGVTIMDVSEDIAEAQGMPSKDGAIVTNVTRGSPAEKHGLKRGDIILSVSGKKVSDATSTTRLVGNLIANTSNEFVVLRKGREVKLHVTVGVRPDDPYARVSARTSDEEPKESDMKGDELSELNVSLRPVDDDIREALDMDENEKGLLITDLKRKSPLYKARLREGNVILEANNREVGTISEFRRAIADARKAGRSKVLLAVRVSTSLGGQTTYLAIDLSEEEE